MTAVANNRASAKKKEKVPDRRGVMRPSPPTLSGAIRQAEDVPE
jgi:hypothetical protein